MQLSDRSAFRAVSASQQSSGEVVIQFEKKSQADEGESNQDGAGASIIKELVVTFDRAQHWLPVHAITVEQFGPPENTHQKESNWKYVFGDNGILKEVHTTGSIGRPNGQNRSQGKVTFSVDVVPTEQFYLSYYGLPEPEGVRPTRSRTWWIVGGSVAVLLIVVGSYFARKEKR